MSMAITRSFTHVQWLLAGAMLATLPQVVSAEQFSLGRAGAIDLENPAGWTARVDKGKKGALPTITFTVTTPTRAEALVSPIWKKGEQPLDPNAIRATVNAQGERLLKTANETSVILQNLQGPSVSGLYFSLTDRAPKRGGYPALTQGAAMIGALLVDFTILSPTTADTRIADIIRML